MFQIFWLAIKNPCKLAFAELLRAAEPQTELLRHIMKLGVGGELRREGLKLQLLKGNAERLLIIGGVSEFLRFPPVSTSRQKVKKTTSKTVHKQESLILKEHTVWYFRLL